MNIARGLEAVGVTFFIFSIGAVLAFCIDAGRAKEELEGWKVGYAYVIISILCGVFLVGACFK